MTSSKLVLKIVEEFHSHANPKSENYRTIGQRIQNLIETDRKETTRQAAQRALDWYDSPALYYGPNQDETARETLYKSVLGEEW